MMIRLENYDLYGPGQRGSETAVVVILDSVFPPLVLVLVRNLRRRKHVSSLVTITVRKGYNDVTISPIGTITTVCKPQPKPESRQKHPLEVRLLRLLEILVFSVVNVTVSSLSVDADMNTGPIAVPVTMSYDQLSKGLECIVQ